MAPLNQADLLLNTETDDNDQYITTFKAKIAYQKQLFITYVNSQMAFEDFQKEVREVCCISLEVSGMFRIYDFNVSEGQQFLTCHHHVAINNQINLIIFLESIHN